MGTPEWFILALGFLAGFCIKAWLRAAYDISVIQEQRKIIRKNLMDQMELANYFVYTVPRDLGPELDPREAMEQQKKVKGN